MKNVSWLVRLFFSILLFGSSISSVHSQQLDSLVAVRQVDSLVNLCRSLTGKKQFDEALRVISDAEQVALTTFGKMSVKYGTCVFNHGRTCKIAGKNDEAELLYLEAKDIRKKVLGREHPDYAAILNNLAILYYDKGNYEKAEPLYLEAKDIREKVLGKEHSHYAHILNNLALLYTDKGDYEKSESFYIESKNILEKTLGREHPLYATSLNNLASLYNIKGYYEKSESLHIRAKSIREKVLGKEHSDYAQSLSNLATLYMEKGNYEKAEPLCIEAKNILEKNLGREHSDYATILHNLASLYNYKGDYEKAELLYLEAKGIRGKILGKEHPDYAYSLNNLASLYIEKDNYGKAEPLCIETKNILEKNFGREHPDYATSLNNLADLYKSKGDYEKAELLYLEAEGIRRKVLGKEHSDYALSLGLLANLYRIICNPKLSTNYWIELARSNHSILQKATTYNSEREMLFFIAKFKAYEDQTLSFALAHPQDTLLTILYNNALSQTNALLDAATSRQKSIAHADSSTQDIHAKWKSCHFQLAKWYEKPVNKRDSSIVADLETRAEQYEKELVRRSPAFVESRREVRWREVQAQLRPGEAAIEFVHFQWINDKGNATDTSFYAALVLRPDSKCPQMVRLCQHSQLDLLFSKKGKIPEKLFIQNLYSAEPLDHAASLYQLLWQPLEPHLKGVKNIYYAAAGDLYRVNFSAIYSRNEQDCLGDSLRFVPLGSTRELVSRPAQAETLATDNFEALLVGNIPYEMDTTGIRQSITYVPSQGNNQIGRDNSKGGGQHLPWHPLGDSKREIASIGEVLGKAGYRSSLREGYAASEEAMKQTGQHGTAPRILYISTHGFFLDDWAAPKTGSKAMSGFDTPRQIENPMLRSGLVFAGANLAWTSGQAAPGYDDGILTAYDVARMDLRGTDLVVLSACETGLGQVRGSEGVFGLQRAFRLAGAKSLVMSLWKVPEKATTELLTRFFKNWLDEKMTRGDAFNAAQQWMRGQKNYAHPYFWAGFVLVE